MQDGGVQLGAPAPAGDHEYQTGKRSLEPRGQWESGH